jgi:hypothetical protein
LQWLKVDFDKWADEDDEPEEVAEPDLGGMQNFNMEEVRERLFCFSLHLYSLLPLLR